ncbi:MAG TPA: hypothetical protein VM734_20515 [Kofleriaceae bacterium]|nr:hypothetical protein [Kofleriaceae bacterium]
MGTWGAGVFADDVARDVRQDYLASLAAGEDPARVTRRMVKEWAGRGSDRDDRTVFWLALAATQWEYGRLEPTVKARALAVIDRGDDLARWEGQDGARRAVLGRLRTKLMSRQPRPRMPRPPKPVPEPKTTTVVAPGAKIRAVSFEIGDDKRGWLGQVLVDEPGVGGGGVFAADCRQDEIGLRWKDASTLVISYPANVRVQSRRPGYARWGWSIKILYRAIKSTKRPPR